jgi:hypothetical protein
MARASGSRGSEGQAHPGTAGTIWHVAAGTNGPIGNTPHSPVTDVDNCPRGPRGDVISVLPVRSAPMSCRPPARRLLPGGLLAAALLLAACSPGGASVGSFDPSAPCPAEGRQPGAYPALEALLPRDLDGTAPDSVDSGRSCTADALGTLADRGVHELRFAGATWKTGGTSGLTLARFEAEGLDAGKMLEFYETGARGARRTEKLVTTDVTVGGEPARRLDVLGSDGTGQTVVTWPAGQPGAVWVLLAADVGDTRVAKILETFGSL